MKSSFALFVLLLLPTLAPRLRAEPSRAIVVVVSDGGLGAEAALAARRVATGELAERGYTVVEAGELARLHSLDEEVRRIAETNHADQIFALWLSRFGGEILVEFSRHDKDLTQVGGRRLSAKGPEEIDVIIPRLVEALVTGATIEQPAQVDTVTQGEAEEWNKKPGEFLFGMGIMVGGAFVSNAPVQYGLDLKFSYEMKHFRINGEISGMLDIPDIDDALVRGGIGLSYLILARDWSPYVGASLNYMFLGLDSDYGGGVGFDVNIGVELFRLHEARFLIEFGVDLPCFVLDPGYAAIGHGLVGVLF